MADNKVNPEQNGLSVHTCSEQIDVSSSAMAVFRVESTGGYMCLSRMEQINNFQLLESQAVNLMWCLYLQQ